jgi:hypothetical protein
MATTESLAARTLDRPDPLPAAAAKVHTGLASYTLNDVQATNKVAAGTAAKLYPKVEFTGQEAGVTTRSARPPSDSPDKTRHKDSDESTGRTKNKNLDEPTGGTKQKNADGSTTETLHDPDGGKWVRRTDQNGNYTEDKIDKHGNKTGEHAKHTKNADGSTDDESTAKGIKKTLHISKDYTSSVDTTVDMNHKGKDGKPIEISRHESTYHKKTDGSIDDTYYDHGQKVKTIHKNKDSSRDETEYKDGKPHKLDRYNNAGKLVGTYDLPYKDYDSNGKLVDRYDVPNPSQKH